MKLDEASPNAESLSIHNDFYNSGRKQLPKADKLLRRMLFRESSYLGEVWSRKWELNINSYLTLPLEHRSISWFKLIYRKNKTALGEHQIKEQLQVKFILLSSHWLKVKKKKKQKHCYSILRKIICIYNKKTKKLFLPWEIM